MTPFPKGENEALVFVAGAGLLSIYLIERYNHHHNNQSWDDHGDYGDYNVDDLTYTTETESNYGFQPPDPNDPWQRFQNCKAVCAGLCKASQRLACKAACYWDLIISVSGGTF